MTLLTESPAETTQAEVAPVDAPAVDAPAADPVPAADAPAAEDSKQDAPEAYDWKLPDGVEFDQGGLEAFGEFAKGAGLNNEQANALLGKLAPAIAERQQAAHVAMVSGWVDASRADTEIGGPNLAQNVAVAKKAMDKFGTTELTNLLNDTGLGNHPEIVRAFYRAGKAISEDRFVGGGGPSQGSVDPAKRMFPNMN